MKTPSIKTIKKTRDILQTSQTHWQFLLDKTTLLNTLNQKVSPYLDPAIKSLCQVANVRDSTLVLLVANGSVATQLRFSLPDLLRKFKQDPALTFIKEIQCKVRPTVMETRAQKAQNKPRKVAQLSAETAELLQAMANTLTDSSLKEVMERIATRIDHASTKIGRV